MKSATTAKTVKAVMAVLVVGTVWAPCVEAATGFSWLKLGGSARLAGMGGASAATMTGSEAFFVNPAGVTPHPSPLPQGERGELIVMHSPWIERVSLEALGVALPTPIGSFGLGGFWLSVPGFERRGMNRELLGSFSTTSWTGLLGWSTALARNLSVGMNLKLIGEALDDMSGLGVAFDLGIQWDQMVEGLSLGLMVNHLGPGVKFLSEVTALPTTVTAGLSYQLPAGLRMAMDLAQERDAAQPLIRLGMELTPMAILALRVGYAASSVSGGIPVGSVSLPAGLMGGFGLRLDPVTLDYAAVPVPGFGFTHRFGGTIKL